MVDFPDSSQLKAWSFGKNEHLSWCRSRANHAAREFLSSEAAAATVIIIDPTAASSFARGWSQRLAAGEEKAEDYAESENATYPSQGPWENAKGKAFLNATEEATLVSFYAPKLGTLIGPKADVDKLRRESKVTATAALLYRRFFLSNSIMLYDPKAIMAAAAFLASKVEDATADIRYLEEGTAMKNAPVSQDEIIPAELALMQGIAFDLLCFHPYKTVLALTEDLRTFLKSDKGKSLVTLQDRPINGQDLKPFYDQARTILEEALLRTDVALLYTPGQLGLASLMAAQDSLQAKEVALAPPPLQIDWQGYVRHRFEADTDRKDSTWQALQELRQTLRQPPADFDVVALKAIHKKLKKVRAWGGSDASSSKKRKKEEAADRPAGGSQKKAKIE